MSVPEGLKYTKEHEWLKIDGDTVTVGITDFAQNSLGDIVYVELPEVGESVEAGDSIGNIESVKAVAELYCPISGEVVEINSELEDQPELTNASPFDQGWMIKIKVDVANLENEELMDAKSYDDLEK
jgi:glycine cleavage system H protein